MDAIQRRMAIANLTFLAFSKIFIVTLPVPGPTSRTTSVDFRAA